jgi:hypothetical protein
MDEEEECSIAEQSEDIWLRKKNVPRGTFF